MPSEPSSKDECGTCGHTHLPNTHTCGYTAGESMCNCKGPLIPPRLTEPILNDRCKCSHDRFRHSYASVDGPCSKPDCKCEAYAPVVIEDMELPEPECTQACGEGHTYSGSCMLRAYGPKSAEPGCAVLHLDAQGRRIPCPDETFRARQAERSAMEAPEEPKECSHRCVCGHEQRDHSSSGWCKQCDCEGSTGHYPDECLDQGVGEPKELLCEACGRFAGSWFDRSVCAEPCGFMHDRCANCGAARGHCPLETPPQPDRRPPYAVAYSVTGGHLYEAMVPGDVSVTAEDGVLKIQHPDAMVLGIVRVAPIKESS